MQKCILPLLAALFLAFGCSGKQASEQFYSADSDSLVYYAPAASTRWEGTGYNPEGPAGIEGRTPAFRNMSNLYGEMSQVSAAENTAEPEMALEENAERKIVKQANIRIRVENLEAADAYISDLMEKHGAYAASSVMDENSRHYTIRVPSSAYEAFLAGTDGLGKVMSRSESADDVTLRYYDLEGRLTTRKELLKTFQSYLGKANNIEEILSVERKLPKLPRSSLNRSLRLGYRYDIEAAGPRMARLTVEKSTLYARLRRSLPVPSISLCNSAIFLSTDRISSILLAFPKYD
jgi:hypothetical protein